MSHVDVYGRPFGAHVPLGSLDSQGALARQDIYAHLEVDLKKVGWTKHRVYYIVQSMHHVYIIYTYIL